ncbi:uncharacterized protein LOC117648105 [Thrips palmi]|uniref:Uncharacterized protein LOC117648105 n=1 Tax=Thrips palmi TaxID=161013 RepID=A0A6P8Z176_THRPL|nr:uncharacterized protein LOC117648105 [Thrips palmi]
MEAPVSLLLLAVGASLAAPQFFEAATQPYMQDLQDLRDLEPATPPALGDDDADLELAVEAEDAAEYGWEELKGSVDVVDVPLADVQWSLDQLPPSMRKVLRLVLFDKYKVNFT